MNILQPLPTTSTPSLYKFFSTFPPENGFSTGLFDLSEEAFAADLLARDKEAKGIDLAEGRVPQTYFIFYADDTSGSTPVGVIKIRHYLNDFLRAHGGHIGYGIHPDHRGKGYGSEMLKLGLEEAKKLGIEDVLITCNIGNTPSQKVIERNGGVLEKKTEEDGCFYWIKA